jgi:hypothetical protein
MGRTVCETKCILSAGLDGSEKVLEPAHIIGALPEYLRNMLPELIIRISSGKRVVRYKGESFMLKTYPILSGEILFGTIMLPLDGLLFHVGIEVRIENLEQMTETVVD